MNAVAVHRAGLRLRSMRESDLPRIVSIERRAYPFPWPEYQFRYCLRNQFVCRVLERGGMIEGYGIMAVERNTAHIMNLCVRPESQGQGLGTRLLRHLLTLARRRGLKYAYLEVRPSNYAARSLYYRAGFSEAGRRRGYYPARTGREDALILSRAL